MDVDAVVWIGNRPPTLADVPPDAVMVLEPGEMAGLIAKRMEAPSVLQESVKRLRPAPTHWWQHRTKLSLPERLREQQLTNRPKRHGR